MHNNLATLNDGTIESILHELGEILPTQGPLQIFIHHNTLHGFEEQDFYSGIELAAQVNHAETYLKESEYHKHLANNRIDRSILEQQLTSHLQKEGLAHDAALAALLAETYIEQEDELLWLLSLVIKQHKLSPQKSTEQKLIPDHLTHCREWLQHSSLSSRSVSKLSKKLDPDNSDQHYLTCLLSTCLERTQLALKQMRLNLGPGLINYANKVFNINPEDHFLKLCATYLDNNMALEPAFEHNTDLLTYGLQHLAKSQKNLNPEIIRLVSDRKSLTTQDFFERLLKLSYAEHRAVQQFDNCREIIYRLALKFPGWAGAFTLRGQLFEFVCLLLCFKQAYNFSLTKLPGNRISSLAIATRLFWLASKNQNIADQILTSNSIEADALVRILISLEGNNRLRIFHKAYEDTLHSSFLQTVKTAPKSENSSSSIKYNFVFCIDEREESMRRHVESAGSYIATYGYAGFFGLDATLIDSQGNQHAICPPLVKPSKTILSQKTACCTHNESFVTNINRTLFNLQLNPISAAFISLLSPLLVGLTVLKDRFAYRHAPASTASDFKFEYLVSDKNPNGFSYADIALRLGNLLKTTGLVVAPGELIVLVGHGANGANNPYKSAYDCGACGGKPGDINTKIFAEMANLPEVRAELSKLGTDLPATTLVVGAYHNTTTDEFIFFDTNKIPQERQNQISEIQIIVKEASTKNALERSRRFASIQDVKINQILDEVKRRAYYIAEPRPEYGHATNALCVVGRRELTKNLFLDRRAFLVSYEASIDPNHAILASILKAIVPVCMGINLEYFFSSVDNYKYGAGSKLPQNVVAGCATMTGSLGDLRTGLPKQMIEIHEPVRLAMLVQSTRAAIDQILTSEPTLRNPIKNGWFRLYLVDPNNSEISAYRESDQNCLLTTLEGQTC